MPRAYSLQDNSVENRVFFNRIVAAFFIVLLLTAGLVVRLVYLQIVGHDHYATLAKENSVKIQPLVPARGLIYDRNGKVLAENTQSFSLELIPEQISDMDATLSQLQKLLNIPNEKIEQFQKQRKHQKRFISTPLLLSMTDEEIAKFAVVRPYFTGVDIASRLVRNYPYSDLAAHVVGYVSRINEAEMKTLPLSEYRAINTFNTVPPVSGANLHLTLDIDLQKTAYDALEGYNGAVVALDVTTGGVLVFSSRPGFNPNPFVVGIDYDAYQNLQSSENQPLYNRALRGLYPPGSTMKPFVALAGLEYNAVGFEQKHYCPGFYQLPNVPHKYRDWKHGGHGWVGMSDAITESCDVYFYSLASVLGIDNMHHFLQQFGFGEKSGIDLVGEKTGLLPSREWKKQQKNQNWYPGETLITGIGQGYLQVTPIQLARATAILANGGKNITPFLVSKIVSPSQTQDNVQPIEKTIPLKSSNIAHITDAMINVIHDSHGTAKNIGKHISYQIAGKTGTAQVFNIKQEARYNENAIDFKLRDHALFIAFAPADNPKIAIAVVVENGGHGGSVAAPIADKVIQQYLESINVH
jgi:penicillin-binding protein 2